MMTCSFCVPWRGILLSVSRVVLVTSMALSGASAQELKFQFTNPSFGGNPFLSGHLLGLADLQNQHEEPIGDSSLSTQNSEGDLFVRQLQSRLLSSLSSSLAEAITGAEPGDTDEITIGDQTIFFERDLETITVRITSLLDDSSTTIQVPVLQSDLGN